MKAGVTLFRDRNGIAHVAAESLIDLYYGQGYVHGRDRLLQMCIMRVLGQGRICELLHDDDESLRIDKFFRRMCWSKNINSEIEKLNVEDHAALEAYCHGVNAAMKKSIPWEFKLLGYAPEPWRPKDCILMARMMAYLTLAQSQWEIERLIVEMVQNGVNEAKLEELFPGQLEGLDIELLKKVTLGERIVKPETLWDAGMPRMMASNNWVVSGSKTKSRKPMLANDPHLEGNRLPNVWYEVVLIGNDRYMMGASMPGLPGVLSGRNNDVAWGVTYAFIDTIDSWVEQCKEGRYFRKADDSWHDFDIRKETIKRKAHPPVAILCYENDHGLLDGDPFDEGYYLATQWSGADSGVTTVVTAMNMWSLKNVKDAKSSAAKIETGWSFVFADSMGHIGFQMSGKVPIRKEGVSGLIPLPGWDAENDWQGFYPPHMMPQCTDPEQGFFCTANNNLNEYGAIDPINVCMASYRAERIDELLSSGRSLTFEDFRKMHFDVYSKQAERFMAILKPLLPNTVQGKVLQAWDMRYAADSQGAYLFELCLKAIYHDVFGLHGLSSSVIKHLAKETGIFIDFYDNFDKVLLKEDSEWFGGQTRDEIFKAAAERALKLPLKRWGDVQKIMLKNIFFDGKLPNVFGFDRGPMTVIGGRATIHQGQIYRSDGRETTFIPSIRMVADMGHHDLHVSLLGGPSDRRFSKWYASDVVHWFKGQYKLLSPMPMKKYRFK